MKEVTSVAQEVSKRSMGYTEALKMEEIKAFAIKVLIEFFSPNIQSLDTY